MRKLFWQSGAIFATIGTLGGFDNIAFALGGLLLALALVSSPSSSQGVALEDEDA